MDNLRRTGRTTKALGEMLCDKNNFMIWVAPSRQMAMYHLEMFSSMLTDNTQFRHKSLLNLIMDNIKVNMSTLTVHLFNKQFKFIGIDQLPDYLIRIQPSTPCSIHKDHTCYEQSN